MAFTVSAAVGSGYPANGAGKTYTMKNTFSFATNNMEDGEYAHLFTIPAGTFVEYVVAKVTTAEGATLTADIGDFTSAGVATDADGYLDGINLNSTSTWSCSAPGTVSDTSITDYSLSPAYARGKFYGATGYIGMECNNNGADTAVVEFTVACRDLN